MLHSKKLKVPPETTKHSLLEFRRYLDGIIATTKAIQTTNKNIISRVDLIKGAVSKLTVPANTPAQPAPII